MFGWPSTGGVEWEVAPRLDRRRSTVFALRAVYPTGHDLSVFYKVLRPSGTDIESPHSWHRAVAEGLARTERLDHELAQLLAEEPITFSRTLLIDIPSSTHLTIGVEGEPLGKTWRHTLTGSRRQRAMDYMWLVGRAASLIEQCTVTSPEVDRDEVDRIAGKTRRRISRALPESMADELASRLKELELETFGKGDLVYAHGDVSSTNLLVREGAIGLIDFAWSPRLRGFDVARFAYRLEYDTVTGRTWAEAAVSALLEGYGHPDFRRSPNWLALRVPWLLKIIALGSGSRFDRYSQRARRAMAEIESIL
jgi:hypothetical protein